VVDVGDAAGDFFGGGFPSQVAFINGEFVRLEPGLNGLEVARSPDGSDWQLESTTGLPRDGFVQSLVSSQGTLVAVIEDFGDFIDPFEVLFQSGLLTDDELSNICDFFPDEDGSIVVTTCSFEDFDALLEEFDEAIEAGASDAEIAALEEQLDVAEEEVFAGEEVLRIEPGDELFDEISGAFFGEDEFFSPEYVVATSNDGVAWATNDLPTVMVEEGFTFVAGAAVSGNRLAVLVSVEAGFNDPFQILFESGLVDDDLLNEICGISSGDPGDPIIFSSCTEPTDDDFETLDQAVLELDEAIEAGASDDEIAALEEQLFALEDEIFNGEEILRLEPGDELYDQLAESFFVEPEALPPVVLTGPLGGSFQSVELPTAGFASGIAGTNEGFIATVSTFDGGPTVLRSTDGLSWTPVERFEDFREDINSDVAVAANDELAIAIVLDFDGGADNAAPVVLTSDDLGLTWSESELPTELFGIFPAPIAGPAGFATLIEGTTEPFNFFGPESVEVTQGDFVMEVRLNEDTAALRTVDGAVIHESVSLEEAFEGGVPGVLQIGQPGEEAVWFDPETGEELVVFFVDDIITAIDDAFLLFEDDGEQPVFVQELWFSVDGQSWTLLETFETDLDEDEFTSIAAVGDDEILLLTESFPLPPEELFLFEEEGRAPTSEEEAAIEEFFLLEPSFIWTRVPVG